MTHRKKIVAIDASYSIEEALRFMLNESYSRFPLYQENIDDNWVGKYVYIVKEEGVPEEYEVEYSDIVTDEYGNTTLIAGYKNKQFLFL